MDKTILFYDSSCPLCLHEVRMLEKRNKRNLLVLADLHNPSDMQRYPHIDKVKAMDILHAQNAKGELLLGLDATHAAWSSVGLGFVSAPLRWPVIRYVADYFYSLFVTRRHSISRLLMGKSHCSNGQCSTLKGKNKRHG